MSKHPLNDKERPHCVDSIKELDNPLPRWWVWLFNISIVYGIFYLIWIHIAGGPLLLTELQEDMAAKKTVSSSDQREGFSQGSAKQQPSLADENFASNFSKKLSDQAYLKEGEAHFASYCSPCHRPDLGGQIGPNLTDDYWMHGCTPEAVVKTITEGVPAKGMAAWGPILGEEKIGEVTAYIFSKIGSKPANPKEQQGDLCVWKPQ